VLFFGATPLFAAGALLVLLAVRAFAIVFAALLTVLFFGAAALFAVLALAAGALFAAETLREPLAKVLAAWLLAAALFFAAGLRSVFAALVFAPALGCAFAVDLLVICLVTP
jgi:hypothetical protein